MQLLTEEMLTIVNSILVGIVTAIALVSLLVIIIIFSILSHRQKKYNLQITDSSNSLSVFVIDSKNDRVSYFNSIFLKERRTSSITSFYNLFKARERDRLIEWVGELLEGKEETPKILEVKVYNAARKINIPSILKVTKFDDKKGLIYLESRFMKDNLVSQKKGVHHHDDTKEMLSRKILINSGRGATFCINFFDKQNKTNNISTLAYAGLKFLIIQLSNEKVIISEHDFGKIIIANFLLNGIDEQYSYIELIKTKINKYLLIESFADEIDFTIGVIDNQINFRDVNTLIKNVVGLSELAKDETEKVQFYNEKRTISLEEQSQQYRTDVEQIIQDNKLKYLFQPLMDFDRKRVIGYRTDIEPIDSYFKNIEDLKNYAMRTEDDKELFSTIVRNAISRFVYEREDPNIKLFLPISYNEINYVNRSLGHISGINDANIVLVLKEEDLSDIPEDYGEEGFINTIRSFKSKGYAVALEIDDDVLTLTPTIYSLFDYFNLSVASHISKKTAGSNLPTFQGLIEKLLHYGKPIVATNIASWEIVELVYKLGVGIICSDAIALPEENILPLPKKILNKIINLKS